MKVFVAGATGVLGRELVPQLVARGHEVVGMTRSASKQDLVRSLGARPVVADALDPDAVAQAVASAEPEVIVHQLTALSGRVRPAPHRPFLRRPTNRLRTEGTDHLLAAGRAVGARRFVAQSFAGFRSHAPADRCRPRTIPRSRPAGGAARRCWRRILYLEQAVTTIEWGEGLVLRYGGFYGPGTTISLARTRRWRRRSASAGSRSSETAAASGPSSTSTTPRRRPRLRSSAASAGVYNVVDDDPAPGAGVAARAGQRAGRQAAEARPALARSAPGR